jgi:glucan phosphoethanolaminetransferase (alkaline phosphatase superfamily)
MEKGFMILVIFGFKPIIIIIINVMRFRHLIDFVHYVNRIIIILSTSVVIVASSPPLRFIIEAK